MSTSCSKLFSVPVDLVRLSQTRQHFFPSYVFPLVFVRKSCFLLKQCLCCDMLVTSTCSSSILESMICKEIIEESRPNTGGLYQWLSTASPRSVPSSRIDADSTHSVPIKSI